eukprot:EC719099.1.p1 GENE.EC719099.1~~EC719099.1.p1  ORF type:complete len:131 (+),score=29.74 EC719099.1:42-434(+)
MSWDAWASSLVSSNSKVILNAAIVGQDGSLWGATEHNKWAITQTEIDKLCGQFKNPSSFQEGGITLSGVKYMCTKVDLDEGRSVHGRKAADGVILVKTGQCYVVAIYTQDARHASVAAEAFADKLIASGY